MLSKLIMRYLAFLWLSVFSISAHAFWIYTDGSSLKGNHQQITFDAVSELEYTLNNGEKVKFTEDAIKELKKANKNIDDDDNTAHNPRFHCDNEKLTACSRFVESRKNSVVRLAKTPSVDFNEAGSRSKLMRENLGGALHTLQDFYSHSNWINISSSINDTFGTSAFTYVRPGDTCEADSSKLIPLPELTSGYYEKNPYAKYPQICDQPAVDAGICSFVGDTYTPLSYNAPYKLYRYPLIKYAFNKCVHGHVCNGTDFVCEIAKRKLFGAGTEGIHKDSRYRQPSVNNNVPPDNHDQAERQAELATKKFINDVVEEIRKQIPNKILQDKAICELLGRQDEPYCNAFSYNYNVTETITAINNGPRLEYRAEGSTETDSYSCASQSSVGNVETYISTWSADLSNCSNGKCLLSISGGIPKPLSGYYYNPVTGDIAFNYDGAVQTESVFDGRTDYVQKSLKFNGLYDSKNSMVTGTIISTNRISWSLDSNTTSCSTTSSVILTP